MPRLVHLHLLPALAAPETFRRGIAVVIDLLRASTTIAAALAAGAERVIACAEPTDALLVRESIGTDACLLGGERGGLRIDGFDLGNSPAEYTSACIAGRTVVFTTTNGTRAALHAREAAAVYFGCLGNRAVLVRELLAHAEDIHIIAAGTNGVVGIDDVLCGGLFARDLLARGLAPGPDDGVRIGLALAELADTDPDALSRIVRESRGGRNLQAIGLAGDIETCLRADSIPVVPRLVFESPDGLAVIRAVRRDR